MYEEIEGDANRRKAEREKAESKPLVNERKDLVINVFKEVLQLDDANTIIMDRIHRVGAKLPKSSRPRPIVTKFHYYSDKERIRQLSFTYTT